MHGRNGADSLAALQALDDMAKHDVRADVVNGFKKSLPKPRLGLTEKDF